ncbi:FadR/GntR family transcriptional regulator [Hydrogenophaga sp.]|uniref:FadR/GntR family transcriptional regulator n=1 Tax=Hydrogenophaga sp. TaxID=1904254 RepID=UPI002721A44B|nr:GntR family transcriptional regulator [Hydrogenophaga sp.]MDO9504292.1 GntR family transcriptional regulator [Hydrogenophaga sp.]
MPAKAVRRTSAPSKQASSKPAPALPVAPSTVFQPVRTRRGFEAVCDQIRQQLARGELRPGDRLPAEKDLAEQFDISRSGVREALRSLEAAGLVEARTGIHGGFYIHSGNSSGLTQTVQDLVSLGQVSIANVTEARVELMKVAIRLACARATQQDLDAIEVDIEHHTELFREGQGSRNTKSVIEFYRLIARATHNDVIVMMVDALSELIRALLARVDPQPRKDFMQVRRKVLAQMRERDAQGAADVMELHLRHVSDYLESENRKTERKRKMAA